MIEPISNNLQLFKEGLTSSDKIQDEAKPSFSQLMKDNLDKVNQLQIESDQITTDFALGKVENIHDVTIAAEKAKLALNMTVAIQGKLLSAYQEIMRMQL